MSDQEDVSDKGGTMRLGSQECHLLDVVAGTKAHAMYGTNAISERHRHRFEFNNDYRAQFEEAGMACAARGINPEKRPRRDHRARPATPSSWRVQFHPEFKSKPTLAHPLFREFVAAATAHSKGGTKAEVAAS